MEIIRNINNAIDYIEDNLDSDLNIDEIAKVAYTSRYHFQHLFHAVTGFTLTEYIRNRKLTLAAEELAVTDTKVIDIALRYGYDSPDAFTKAFQRLHKVTPSALRKGNVKIKAFPKLLLQISIKGEFEVNYKIVDKEPHKVFGVDFETTLINDALYSEIPEFCEEIWENGTHLKINEFLGYHKMNLLHGIHFDFKENGNRRFMMGWEAPEKEIPNEYKVVDVPASTWAVFEGKSNMGNKIKIQDVWRQIYSEWFPSSGFEQVEGPCIEKYYWDDGTCNNYTCEVWIPIKRK